MKYGEIIKKGSNRYGKEENFKFKETVGWFFGVFRNDGGKC